jgi:Mg-chelatase subunit ChlD
LSTENQISYPHIKGAGVVIPDCSRGVYTPFRLTSREKRELVRKLAEKGLGGIDDYLEEKRTQGAIFDRLDELRKRMSDELERIRTLRRSSLDEQIRELSSSSAYGIREARDVPLSDESSFRRFSSEEIRGEILASELIGALEGRHEIKERRKKTGFFKRLWEKIKDIILRIFLSMVSFLGRIRNRLFRRKVDHVSPKAGERPKGAISLPFPSLRSDLEKWEGDMERRLEEDKNLQRAVDVRISDSYGYSSGLIRLKRSYDPLWYHREAKKLLRKEVENSAEKKKNEIERKREEKLRKLKKTEIDERKAREKIMELERNFEEEMKERSRSIRDLSKKQVKKEVLGKLSQMGYISKTSKSENLVDIESEWEITEALVEKFSELIYAEVMEGSRGIRDRRGKSVSDAGVYEKAKLRMIGEEARMDILQTVVNARINHPSDRTIDHNDMMVLREVTTTELHGIIIVDVSGSMWENQRLEAAKRSVLALTQAIKRDNPRNKVDIISMSTRAKPIPLKEVMKLEPKGFTNHQEALALATEIFSNSRADRYLLFLITDGLPEAYTDEGGKAVAGDLEKSMELALFNASSLLRFGNLVFNIFLLEPEDETYVNSARRIAKEGEGRVIIADPKELASRVIGSFDEGVDVLGGV